MLVLNRERARALGGSAVVVVAVAVVGVTAVEFGTFANLSTVQRHYSVESAAPSNLAT